MFATFPHLAKVRTLSRTERLLDLLQILRRHRHPTSGAALADELGVSLRTLYRDIATLRAQGAQIEGEPGLGYVMRPGFMLPPLMFCEEEIEALVLGSRWVADRADDALGGAARAALTKIAAVLPSDLRDKIDTSTVLVGPMQESPAVAVDLSLIRQAVRRERKLVVHYRDLKEVESTRIIWPFALAFFERVRVLAAWCELRGDYRHFRADRIIALTPLETRYPRRRQVLLREWRIKNKISSA